MGTEPMLLPEFLHMIGYAVMMFGGMYVILNYDY